MDPIAFHLGPIAVHWYGILIAAAFLIGVWGSLREAKRQGIDEDHFLNLVIAVIICAIVGARAYYVVFEWDYYRDKSLLEIIATWHGGLAIHGGVIGGILACAVCAWHYRLRIWQLLDIIAPYLILGQAIGRWGNFFNQEAYGYEVEELDMGGGLGIAYKADDKPSTIDEFAECTVNAVRENCERLGVKLPRLAVEPGRSLVATPGLTLYTVGILKTLPGIRKYVAIDGGMSDNIRTALYHADYEPTIANKAGQPRTEIVTLCGKHCESGDAVVIDMPLQTPDLGDVIAVFGTGAYCYTMASNYNGQPRPGIVFVKDGQARVVTRRETYADLYHRDI